MKLISPPTASTSNALSFSAAGAHLAYTQDQSLYAFDIATGKGIVLGLAGAQFLGWSPDATGLIYSTPPGVVIAAVGGKTAAPLPFGQPPWPSPPHVRLGPGTCP